MRKPLVIAVAILVAAILAVVGFLALRPRAPERIALAADVDERARAALTAALADYNSSRERYVAALAEAGSSESGADIYLGPLASGAAPADDAADADAAAADAAAKGPALGAPAPIPWRSVGWRLWARQETLAALEGALGRGLILPLRQRRTGTAALEELFSAAQAAGISPLVLPVAPASFESALRAYSRRLGAAGAGSDWAAKGWVRRVPDQPAASRAIETGRALFILGPDSLGELLPRTADCHAEGFPLPTGTADDGRWAMGQADAFRLPAAKKISPGVADLLGYLTSPGLARRFSRELPGEFYSWSAEPGKGQLPLVDAPAEFLSLGVGASVGASAGE